MHTYITSLVFLSLVFVWGVGSGDFDFVVVGKYFLAQAGSAIGVTASVPPNPFNTLAQQLKEKEDGLELKEKALNEREKAMEQGNMNYIVYGSLGVLSLLVMANFYLDYKRRNSDLNV